MSSGSSYILERLALNPNLREQVLEALESKAESDGAYAEYYPQSDHRLTFEDAVEIASKRIGRAVHKFSKNAEADLLSGILALRKYGGLNRDWDEGAILLLLHDAKRNYWSYLALRFIAFYLDDRVFPILSDWKRAMLLLGTFQVPKRPSGNSPFAKVHRDTLIVSEIRQLERCGFFPTRNAVSEAAESACDVVVEALGRAQQRINYKAVEKIWSKRSDLPRLTL
jgi:hypothetical protein